MTESLLCLTLAEGTLAGNLELLERSRGTVDCVELRADFLKAGELAHLERFPNLAGIPAILALKPRQQGGLFDGGEGERLRLLERASGAGFRWVELEEGSSERAADRIRGAGARIIRFLYDGEGVPPDLPERLRRLVHRPGDIAKAELTARSSAELLRVIRTALEAEGLGRIVMARGEAGIPTRLLAPRLGSCFTYCSGAEVGHGFRRLGEKTRLFAAVGNPIAHSLSPLIHNSGFTALGLDAFYFLFWADDLASFFPAAELLGLEGLSITVPHKVAVIPFLTAQEEAVRLIGACNTLVRRPQGWWGANTDSPGFLKPLADRFGAGFFAGKAATVVGAGGAARAVVQALCFAGMRVLILNRSKVRAEELARRFGCDHGPLEAEGFSRIRGFNDLIAQTTPAGMEGQAEVDPLPGYSFQGTEVLYDLIYRPALTRLMGRAAAAGCPVIGGIEMLMAQARLQFKLFTGCDYPPETEKELRASGLPT